MLKLKWATKIECNSIFNCVLDQFKMSKSFFSKSHSKNHFQADMICGIKWFFTQKWQGNLILKSEGNTVRIERGYQNRNEIILLSSIV